MQDYRLDRFRTFVASQGKRWTTKRAAVAQVAFADDLSGDPDEMLARIHLNDGAPISRATLFRVLQELRDAGLY